MCSGDGICVVRMCSGDGICVMRMCSGDGICVMRGPASVTWEETKQYCASLGSNVEMLNMDKIGYTNFPDAVRFVKKKNNSVNSTKTLTIMCKRPMCENQMY